MIHMIREHIAWAVLLGVSALTIDTASAGDRCPQAVDEFKMSAFGGQYSCRKIACDPTPEFADPTPHAVKVQLVCDGDYRIVARHGGRSQNLDTFDSKERCLRAVEQFKTSEGCFCNNNYVPKCLARDTGTVRFDEMASAFSRPEQCARALEQISQDLKAKPR